MRLLNETLGITKIIQHSRATDLYSLKIEVILKLHTPTQRKSTSINSTEVLIESEQCLLYHNEKEKVKQSKPHQNENLEDNCIV